MLKVNGGNLLTRAEVSLTIIIQRPMKQSGNAQPGLWSPWQSSRIHPYVGVWVRVTLKFWTRRLSKFILISKMLLPGIVRLFVGRPQINRWQIGRTVDAQLQQHGGHLVRPQQAPTNILRKHQGGVLPMINIDKIITALGIPIYHPFLLHRTRPKNPAHHLRKARPRHVRENCVKKEKWMRRKEGNECL